MSWEVVKVWRHAHDKMPDGNGKYRYMLTIKVDEEYVVEMVYAVDEFEAYLAFIKKANA